MKSTATKITYEVVRSRRRTADIVIERDGSVLVRAPRRSPPNASRISSSPSATGFTETWPNGGT